MTDATWPYSTHDEVSHLCCSDVPVLRARIDQLLEERYVWRSERGFDEEVALPSEWRLTPQEYLFFAALVRAPEGFIVSKEYMHRALSKSDEPETEPQLVNVIACNIRKKLKPFGLNFETVWGRGYRLSADVRQRFHPQLQS